LGNLLRNEPDCDDAETADRVTEAAEEAREICRRPLPDLDGFGQPDSAA
jgi:hypothetical protein